MAGVYVHVPFCESRCRYCGFYSTTLLSLRGDYVDALCREMDLRRDYLSEPVSTIYVGGGTPSLLSPSDLSRVFNYIYKVYLVTAGAEVTIECNPDDLTPDFVSAISSLPVNRVSMGAQTFSKKHLALMNRRHEPEDVRRAVGLLRGVGIDNVSLDLMFGFPDETMKEWVSDIDEALALDVEHISAYGLTYEEGTPLWRMRESGKVREIDEELSLAMYDELVRRLALAGYERYEISNFARDGRRSRHNSGYWSGAPYIGLGAAAHSFDLKSRQWNVQDVRKYIAEIGLGRVPMEREELDKATMFNDMITTATRTSEGISLDMVTDVFGEGYREALLGNARRYVSSGLMRLSGDRLSLTDAGVRVSDMVMSDLMIV